MDMTKPGMQVAETLSEAWVSRGEGRLTCSSDARIKALIAMVSKVRYIE